MTGAALPLPAQDSLHTLADVTPHGEVIARLRSRANPKATYAAYLPSRYTSDRRWPLLILLDPRGRAAIPLELFREPAERLGYVVLSSFDSQSDGLRAPNDMALDAMLEDAQRYLAVDTKRIYLVGFSGTARFAWDVSEQFPGALAGILGFGAGTPGDKRWLAQHVRGAPFDYYGSVGNLDPNYAEMRQLEHDLTDAAIPFRIEGFEGPHTWPPAALCRRALEWMELRAMRRGLRTVDAPWIDSLARARRSEFPAAGPTATVAAWRARRAWLADFGGSPDSAQVAAEVSRLYADPAVTRTLQREEALQEKDLAWMRGYFSFLTDLKRADPPPGVGDGKRRAGVDEMVRMAAQTEDSLGAIAGRRGIARLLVYATFYEFRDYLAGQQWERASTLLHVAQAAAPTDGAVCFALARVEAQRGKTRDALAQLECAEKAGVLTRDLLQNPLLAPLAREERFTAIGARISR
ncbi:MAG: hypothetical protein U0132_14845 [Gemmatimonadaceae bacterium]